MWWDVCVIHSSSSKVYVTDGQDKKTHICSVGVHIVECMRNFTVVWINLSGGRFKPKRNIFDNNLWNARAEIQREKTTKKER